MKILLLLFGLLGAGVALSNSSSGTPWSAAPAQVSFHGNGNAKRSVTYAHGKLHGPSKEWYADGSRASEGRFERGLRQGAWTFWRSDGSVDEARSGLYAHGKRRSDDEALAAPRRQDMADS